MDYREEIRKLRDILNENGYRYYSYHQLTNASVIVSLRQAGMS